MPIKKMAVKEYDSQDEASSELLEKLKHLDRRVDAAEAGAWPADGGAPPAGSRSSGSRPSITSDCSSRCPSTAAWAAW